MQDGGERCALERGEERRQDVVPGKGRRVFAASCSLDKRLIGLNEYLGLYFAARSQRRDDGISSASFRNFYSRARPPVFELISSKIYLSKVNLAYFVNKKCNSPCAFYLINLHMILKMNEALSIVGE